MQTILKLTGCMLFGVYGLGLIACAPQDESAQVAVPPAASAATSSSRAEPAPAVTLEADSFDRLAQSLARQVHLEETEGLEVSLWAPDKLLADPVALNVDYQGRVWTAVTVRGGGSEFDIRGYPHWEEPSLQFQTPEDRRDFLRTVLAPEHSDDNDWLTDRNKDGLHDWRDLAVDREQVLLLEDRNRDGKADRSQIFLEDFHSEITDILGGIYYHNERDELYLGVSPHAWRVRDTDGDGSADDRKQIASGFGVHIGFGGHGMSGMRLGPDGRIYYAIGDVSANIVTEEGHRRSYPGEGVIVRSEPDGSGLEVFAHGLRNTHEFTFDQYGNLITVDNDGDHDGEYERLLHVIDGSDTGWRINWQFGKYRDAKNNDYKVWMDERYYTPRFDEQSAHILPPIAPYHAGPTGMVFNPGTALGEQWRDHFFVVEFVGSAARSGVHAFTLKPEGASFALEKTRHIFRGLLITGIDFGPDGALYMADWVEGWGPNGKGRIWTMDSGSDAQSEVRAATQSILQQDFSALDTEALRQYLAHADMRVRQRAQLTLAARQDVDTLLASTAGDEPQLARIHAIWGLGQLTRRGQADAAALLPLLRDDDAEIRAQVARVLGDAVYHNARPALVENLAHESARVRLLAVQALGRIGHREDQAAIVAMLAANDDRDVYLRHAGATALARIGDTAYLGGLHTHSSEAVRVAAVVALKRLQSAELARFLADSSDYVVTNAARGIVDDQLVTGALPALAALLDELPVDNEPLVRRSINANLYVGGEQAVQRLLHFARRDTIDSELRAEAVATLGTWTDSSPFDRVTGVHRGAVSHPAGQVRAAFAATAESLLGDDSENVRAAAVTALARLRIDAKMPALVSVLQEDDSARVRIAALEALFELDYPQMGQVAMVATGDSTSEVRMAALGLLPRLKLPTEEVVAMHQILLHKGSVAEQQAAYRSLGNVDHTSAHQLLADSLEKLRQGELDPAVQLDVVEAIEAASSPALTTALAEYEAGKNPDDPLQVYGEALYGGDAHAGMMLFRYDSSAQCIRCHMVGHRGAPVGPDLTRIGETLTREQLLQALVDPGARVPAGHGRIAVTLKDGREISGFFAEEREHTLVIEEGDKRIEVDRGEVVSTEYSGSGMPPMGLILDRRQLRDLVAYLATLPVEEDREGH